MIKGTESICGTPIDCLTPGSEKQVTLVCDTCYAETITTYSNYIQGQKTRNFDGKTYCRKCSKAIGGLKKRGKPALHTAERNRRQVGEDHPSWKGGIYLSPDGYPMDRIRKRDSASGWSAYKKRHLLVMESHLERKLEKGEVIHHIDGDKLNSSLSNLWLTDSQGHRNAHASLQEVGYQLIRTGLIHFDTETGQYMADLKLRELLEQPAEANQQPSLEGNLLEGSETSENILSENMNHHERGAITEQEIIDQLKQIISTCNIGN